MDEDRSVLSRVSREPDRTVSYGPDRDQVADIYEPAAGADRGLVLLLHGGYWRPEYDRTHLGPMAEALSAAGWTVGNLEYRRIPGRPQLAVTDAATGAVRVAQLLGRARPTLIGHSAGGYLALLTAAQLPAARAHISGVLALAPVADLAAADNLRVDDHAVREFLGVPAQTRPDLNPAAMPIPRLPISVMHGDQDGLVPMSLALAYVRPGVHFIEVPGATHFSLIDPVSAAWPAVLEAVAQLTAAAAPESK